jgi:hypothetical protein
MMKSLIWSFSVLFMFFLTGCGSGGSAGTGNTVFITAGITTGTSGSVFKNVSSATVNDMSITLTSHAYSAAAPSIVPNSDVTIDSITLGFIPQTYTGTDDSGNTVTGMSPTFTPQYTNNPQGVGGLVPAGGTLRIDGIPIIGPADLVTFSLAKHTLGLLYVEFRYTVNVTFHGVEVNTGKGLSTTIPIGVAIQE